MKNRAASSTRISTGLLDLPRPRLAGRHQLGNAATAIATLRTVFGAGFPTRAIEMGLTSAEWPARMQRLGNGELCRLAPKGAELWLDGGKLPPAEKPSPMRSAISRSRRRGLW